MNTPPGRQGPYESVAANIRAEAARRSMNTTALAELIGLSKATWSRRMGDPGSFAIGEIDAIARALRVTRESLIGVER